MAAKELGDYTLNEIIEDAARRTFIEIHQEEFARYKASLGDAMIIGLRWKADRDKAKADES